MQANADFFQQLAELLPFGIYVVDRQGRIVFWNERASQITGYRAHDLIGRSYRDRLFAECANDGTSSECADSCPIEEALRNGKPVEAHQLLRHRQGHRIPVLVQAIPIRDDQGRIAAVAELFQEEQAGAEGLCWITQAEAQTDPALGIPSRATSRQQLEISLAQHSSGLGVFLVEVENIDQFARSRGKEMVVAVLRAVAQTLAHAMPVPHFLGAWGNGSFLILAPNSSSELNDVLQQRLAALGNGCAITWWGDEVVPHVRVACTMLQERDSAASLVARLEKPETHAATAGER